MNQLKIGKFIADCRREKKLTQLQLAEKLGITDKAISKWERGIAMPDSSIMLELCSILGISVNELLSGEKMNMENQTAKTEDLLIEMTKKEELLRKKLYIRSRVLYFIMMFNLVLVAAIFRVDEFWGINRVSFLIFSLISLIVYVLTGVMVLPMMYESKRFKCRHCQHEFDISKFGKEWFSSYVKCPHCGQKERARRILVKWRKKG